MMDRLGVEERHAPQGVYQISEDVLGNQARADCKTSSARLGGSGHYPLTGHQKFVIRGGRRILAADVMGATGTRRALRL